LGFFYFEDPSKKKGFFFKKEKNDKNEKRSPFILKSKEFSYKFLKNRGFLKSPANEEIQTGAFH